METLWSNSFFDRKMALLPRLFQDKIMQYARSQDRQARLATKLLLKQLLDNYYPDKKIRLQDLVYNQHHQLILPHHLFASSSHSGNMAICAISTRPIGVDIELRGAIQPGVSQYFFTEKEQVAPDRFYEFWTRKEAVLKAAGLGLDKVDLNSVYAFEQTVILKDVIYHTTRLDFHPGYEAQVASRDRLDDLIEPEKIFFGI